MDLYVFAASERRRDDDVSPRVETESGANGIDIEGCTCVTPSTSFSRAAGNPNFQLAIHERLDWYPTQWRLKPRYPPHKTRSKRRRHEARGLVSARPRFSAS